jgi:hypothetical protein
MGILALNRLLICDQTGSKINPHYTMVNLPALTLLLQECSTHLLLPL